MAAMSDFLEGKLLDAIFRGQPYTFPSVVYIGLLTSSPSDAGGGTEVSGGSYVRVKACAGSTQALTDWRSTQNDNLASTGSSGQTTNSIAITFNPGPSAQWGNVGYFGAYDAPTGGNLLFYGALTTPKTVNSGDAAPSFGPGSLVFQIDN